MYQLLILNRPLYPVYGGDRRRADFLLSLASQAGEVDVLFNVLWFEDLNDSIKELSSRSIRVEVNRISLLTFVWRLASSIFSSSPIQNLIYRSSYVIDRHKYNCVICHLSRSDIINSSVHKNIVVDLTDDLLLHYNSVKFNWTLKSLFFILERKRFKHYYSSLDGSKKYLFISERDNFLNRGFVIPNSTNFVKDLFCPNSKNLLFIGNMTSYPNIQAVENFITLNQEKLIEKGFVLYVLGGGDWNYETSFIKRIYQYSTLDSIGIKFSLGLAPMLSGAGLQNKVLDYVSHGIPCLMTSLVSESFPDFPGGFFVSDDIGDYIDSISFMDFCSPDLFRLYIDSNFSFEALSKSYLNLIND